MLQATQHLTDNYRLIVAGAPSIPHEYYNKFIDGHSVEVVYDKTYQLLLHADAAIVTSGTATLETSLFNVPQVVCYATPLPRLMSLLRRFLLKVKYVSLVNLIADEEVVPELVADGFNAANVKKEIDLILFDTQRRAAMLKGYDKVAQRLGTESAPDNAAKIMTTLLRNKQ